MEQIGTPARGVTIVHSLLNKMFTVLLGEKRIERRKTNYSITKVFCCSLPNKLPKIMRHYTFCDTPGARNSPFSVHFFHEYITAKHRALLSDTMPVSEKKLFP